jgi:hypothetical protein
MSWVKTSECVPDASIRYSGGMKMYLGSTNQRNGLTHPMAAEFNYSDIMSVQFND